MASNGHSNGHQTSYTNYVAYIERDGLDIERIGSLDFDKSEIQPLAFASGGAISNLYQVIEIGDSQIKPSGDVVPLSSVRLLAPINGRDILAIGKNYSEHAKEFNSSGYDSSDKVDIPTHPVVFTKRATSIIACGEPIFPHPNFTNSLDYEGEIGVIIGKSGFRIKEEDAMDYVWGYTIINDMTARERQRDHKQFFIGKSPDSFCPMGPIAVPAKNLPKVLRVQTHINKEERQNSTTEDLIFSIPHLIETLSEGLTIQAGDVIATGTPAGVGIGKKPPLFLESGDIVEVSVTGLGTLKNTIAGMSAENETVARLAKASSLPVYNIGRTCGGFGLTEINSKRLFYRKAGLASGPPILFIHGLGGTSEYFTPLINALALTDTHSIHLLDLEGHGLSPTSASSIVTIGTYADDIVALAQSLKIHDATIIAHSMGCFIAQTIAIRSPEIVSRLVLMGPPPSPIPDAGQIGSRARAVSVRRFGMASVVDAVVTGGTSSRTKAKNPLAIAAVRMSLLGQDPEGYAKGCTALAGVSAVLPSNQISATLLVITGEDDKVSSPHTCEQLAKSTKSARVEVLPGVGHWHVFEDVDGVCSVLRTYLS